MKNIVKNIVKNTTIAVAIATAIIIAIIAIAVPTSSLRADVCAPVPTCDEYGQCSYEWVCSPEYYVWQSNEPDWQLYPDFSEVDIRWSSSPTRPNGWYVTPQSDPGRDGDYFVYDGQLWPYMW